MDTRLNTTRGPAPWLVRVFVEGSGAPISTQGPFHDRAEADLRAERLRHLSAERGWNHEVRVEQRGP